MNIEQGILNDEAENVPLLRYSKFLVQYSIFLS
jgi:hypothetical protein